MRLNLFITEYKKNWLIASLGIILYAIGFAILGINEGKNNYDYFEII